MQTSAALPAPSINLPAQTTVTVSTLVEEDQRGAGEKDKERIVTKVN